MDKHTENRVIEAIEHEMETLEKEIEDLVVHSTRVQRWSFLLAVLLIGVMFSVLSANLTVGPRWIVLVVVTVLFIPLFVAIVRGHHQWTRRLAFAIVSVLTAALVTSVIFLVHALFKNTETGLVLFRDALLLWSVNVILFAIWYWEVDQGGPFRRHSPHPEPPDLFFPQMATDSKAWRDWTPSFTDYVFLAFNSSTAFSPTDTLVMSRRAKVLMMTQASISLIILAVLAARAINIA